MNALGTRKADPYLRGNIHSKQRFHRIKLLLAPPLPLIFLKKTPKLPFEHNCYLIIFQKDKSRTHIMEPFEK